MRDFSTPRTFILSAFKDDNTPEQNHAAHCDLASDLALDGAPHRACEGCYQGTLELGFIVTGAGNQSLVADLAREYGQETYLVIAEHDRIAYLVDTETGFHKHLGKFVSVGDVPPDAASWTHTDGLYFTTDDRTGVDLPEGL